MSKNAKRELRRHIEKVEVWLSAKAGLFIRDNVTLELEKTSVFF